MNTYSLWLIPAGKEYVELYKIINRFSQKHSVPKFEPHVTLIGGIKAEREVVIINTKKTASHIGALSLTLTNIGIGSKKHRAVFINCYQDEKIRNAYKKAKEIFKHQEVNFQPHVSLIYGFFKDEEKREMIKKIKSYPKRLKFTSTALYNTEDENEEKWYKIINFKLR